MQRLLIICASIVISTAMSDAHSAGGGSGSGSGSGGGGSGGGNNPALVNDADYQAAMAAVRKNDWKQVVERMRPFVQREPGNADAWNELGHAHRMLGDMDQSFANYARALQIDPQHKDAHEYLGEAYLQIGNLVKAEQELQALDSICFFPCEQYTDLKKQVRQYRLEHPIPVLVQR